jgi:hypothetical protein
MTLAATDFPTTPQKKPNEENELTFDWSIPQAENHQQHHKHQVCLIPLDIRTAKPETLPELLTPLGQLISYLLPCLVSPSSQLRIHQEGLLFGRIRNHINYRKRRESIFKRNFRNVRPRPGRWQA